MNWWSIDKKEPPLALLPLMICLGLIAMVVLGWALTQTIELKGQRDEILYYRGLSSRP